MRLACRPVSISFHETTPEILAHIITYNEITIGDDVALPTEILFYNRINSPEDPPTHLNKHVFRVVGFVKLTGNFKDKTTKKISDIFCVLAWKLPDNNLATLVTEENIVCIPIKKYYFPR